MNRTDKVTVLSLGVWAILVILYMMHPEYWLSPLLSAAVVLAAWPILFFVLNTVLPGESTVTEENVQRGHGRRIKFRAWAIVMALMVGLLDALNLLTWVDQQPYSHLIFGGVILLIAIVSYWIEQSLIGDQSASSM